MTLAEIKKRAESLAKVLDVSSDGLPTFGYSLDGAHPFIEVDKRGFHFVVRERGREIERKTTTEIDELLFWIFEGLSFSLATQYELENRVENQDCRRLIFAKQEALLGTLNKKWQAKAAKAHKLLLQKYPFDDFASIRAVFSKELRDRGVEDDAAWEKACEKYPLPKHNSKGA